MNITCKQHIVVLVKVKQGGSYPGHLSKVCVHVLVADWNHLPDVLVVTGGNKTHIHQLQINQVTCVRASQAHQSPSYNEPRTQAA